MWLVKAYKGNEQTEAAIALCNQLLTHEKNMSEFGQSSLFKHWLLLNLLQKNRPTPLKMYR